MSPAEAATMHFAVDRRGIVTPGQSNSQKAPPNNKHDRSKRPGCRWTSSDHEPWFPVTSGSILTVEELTTYIVGPAAVVQKHIKHHDHQHPLVNPQICFRSHEAKVETGP